MRTEEIFEVMITECILRLMIDAKPHIQKAQRLPSKKKKKITPKHKTKTNLKHEAYHIQTA